jgi:hypothetical protein
VLEPSGHGKMFEVRLEHRETPVVWCRPGFERSWNRGSAGSSKRPRHGETNGQQQAGANPQPGR